MELNDNEQKELDCLISDVDYYRQAQTNYSTFEYITKENIRKLLKERNIPLNVVYTSEGRRVCLDGDIVKVERFKRH